MANCPYCLNEVSLPIGRTTECSKCRKELHTCKCCRFYSPGSHWDCIETIEDPVTDKDRGNFCDHFMLRTTPLSAKEDKAAEARKKLEALFG